MAERAKVAGFDLVEVTEFSTSPKFEGHGLITANVMGLVSQVLSDKQYSKNSQSTSPPVIISELNTSSTAFYIGAKVSLSKSQFSEPSGKGRF